MTRPPDRSVRWQGRLSARAWVGLLGPLRVAAMCLGAVLAAGCGEQPPQAARMSGPDPAELQAGEAAFGTYCARCHGGQARGTNQGPPLVHKIYEPSHHGDAAFYRAAANGVRAHHWNFGNMPPVEGVTTQEVGQIIQYVRWLQRQAGIH